MKKIILFALPILLMACSSSSKDGISLDDFKDRVSYSLGADMGVNLLNLPDEILSLLDKEEMENGFYDFLSEDKPADDCFDVLTDAVDFETATLNTDIHTAIEVSNCYGAIFGEMLRKSLSMRDGLDEIDYNAAKIGFGSALREVDTLIVLEERQKMIVDFNNDLNKRQGDKFIAEKVKEFPENVKDEGYVLIEKEAGTGDPLDLSGEFEIVYSITNVAGDTVISTYRDVIQAEEMNTQVVDADDVIFPEAWRLAAKDMRVGGKYIIYANYDLGFGEEGLRNPNTGVYVIQPYVGIVIHTKVLAQDEKNASVKKRNEAVLAEAKAQPNTVVDPSGFVLTTLKKGTGNQVPAGGDVKANYILTNSQGEVVENSFMNSSQGMEAPTFSLNSVVRGWQLGIPKMRIGGRYKLVLPPDLAYGDQGSGGKILPGEVLTFEIEIVDAGKSGSLVKAQPGGQQQQITEEQLKALQEQMQLESAE